MNRGATLCRMSDPAQGQATYEDILAAPDHVVAELIAGKLSLRARPAGPHAAASSALVGELGPPFRRGRGGPGGWIILFEPELHLHDGILVPDVAGWRRETMAHVPNVPYFETRPDWVCEVLSPSTEKTDRADKLPTYGKSGVGHLWLVNPLLRTLEVLRRQEQQWLTLAVHRDEDRVRAEPFESFELELGVLWADVKL